MQVVQLLKLPAQHQPRRLLLLHNDAGPQDSADAVTSELILFRLTALVVVKEHLEPGDIRYRALRSV